MSTSQAVSNPFALLMDPQSVLRAIENSQRLETLQRRVCRPLDKPLLPHKTAANDVPELDADSDIALDLDRDLDLDLGTDPLSDEH